MPAKPSPSVDRPPQLERRVSARRHLGRPLKIALLSYRSDPYVGGQGIYLKYLADALATLGHQVDVYSGPPYPQLTDNVRLTHVPSLNLYEHKHHPTALRWHHLRSYTDIYEWWTMLTGGFGEPYTFGRRIHTLLAENDYDIIHDNQSLSYGLLALQALGHKVVSTIHHPIHRDRESALAEAPDFTHRWLVKRWYSFLTMQEQVARKLNHVTTVSRASCADIQRYMKRTGDIRVISNGVDTHTFRPLPVKKHPFRLITTASSDQPVKGLPYLLRALAQAVKIYPQAHLRIIGTLKKGGTAANLIGEFGLHKHVSFRTGLSTQEMVHEYNKASIAVCPSLYEGFGLPAAEAMACGLPVVSSNGGALPEVIGDAGIVVEAGDAMALGAGIQLLFDSRELALSLAKAGRKRAVDQFCWRRVAERMTRYYQDILAE